MFKRGQITALVATEVAARGLDIKELPHVVNYELPNVPEDYVHRIGRTGRAGAGGEAVSLVSSDESGLLRDIERVLRRSIPTLQTPAFKIVESPRPPRLRSARRRPRAGSHGDIAGRGQRTRFPPVSSGGGAAQQPASSAAALLGEFRPDCAVRAPAAGRALQRAPIP